MIPNPAAVLPALKGARAAVLLALMMSPGSMGPNDLADLTNYDRVTVSKALRGLSALNLAQQHARYSGWTTTQIARQMVLGELPPGEDETLLLPSSSCRFTQAKSDDPPIITTTTTTTEGEDETLLLPVHWRKLRTMLIHSCATPPRSADSTIRKLISDDADPLWTQIDALGWIDYCNSDAGTGIGFPGAFIPTRLEQDIQHPDHHTLSYATKRAIRNIQRQIDRRDQQEEDQ